MSENDYGDDTLKMWTGLFFDVHNLFLASGLQSLGLLPKLSLLDSTLLSLGW